MKTRSLKLVNSFIVACAFLFLIGQAQALTITPSSTPVWFQDQPTGTTQIEAYIRDNIIPGFDVTIPELYKSDFDDLAESGLFAASYDTVYSEFATLVDKDNNPVQKDPSGAVISYVSSMPFISANPLYLLVKDGNHTPAWYLFDLSSSWNGIDPITLSGFWPGDAGGAISHVAIYGKEAPIPEPATMLLFGTGLAGLAVVGRRRKN